MRLTDLFEKAIDNKNGWGAVPFNSDVDYFGLRVKMKPSTFLDLALPLEEQDRTSVEAIYTHLKQGGSVGSPFLEISIPDEWIEDENFYNPAQVKGHEGRNRMYALQKYQGDIPVEVHLIPRGGLRARHLTPEIVKELQNGMLKERTTTLVKGPLFEV